MKDPTGLRTGTYYMRTDGLVYQIILCKNSTEYVVREGTIYACKGCPCKKAFMALPSKSPFCGIECYGAIAAKTIRKITKNEFILANY